MLLVRRQHILDVLTRAARGGLGVAGADWQPKLLNALASELRGEKPRVFCSILEQFAQKLAERGAGIQVCHDVVDELHNQVNVALRADPARREQVEEMFLTSHLALSEHVQRGLARETLRLGFWAREISIVCNSLTSAFERSLLRRRIREGLPHAQRSPDRPETHPQPSHGIRLGADSLV